MTKLREEFASFHHNMTIIYRDVKDRELRKAATDHVDPQRSDAETEKLAHELSRKTFEQLRQEIEALEPKDKFPEVRKLFLNGNKAEFDSLVVGFPRQMEKVLRGETTFDTAISEDENYASDIDSEKD